MILGMDTSDNEPKILQAHTREDLLILMLGLAVLLEADPLAVSVPMSEQHLERAQELHDKMVKDRARLDHLAR